MSLLLEPSWALTAFVFRPPVFGEVWRGRVCRTWSSMSFLVGYSFFNQTSWLVRGDFGDVFLSCFEIFMPLMGLCLSWVSLPLEIIMVLRDSQRMNPTDFAVKRAGS